MLQYITEQSRWLTQTFPPENLKRKVFHFPSRYFPLMSLVEKINFCRSLFSFFFRSLHQGRTKFTLKFSLFPFSHSTTTQWRWSDQRDWVNFSTLFFVVFYFFFFCSSLRLCWNRNESFSSRHFSLFRLISNCWILRWNFSFFSSLSSTQSTTIGWHDITFG